MKQALKIGALYFAAVFAVGFVLGTIRTLWVAPRIGVRAAELIESPIMLVVAVLAARAVVRRHAELTNWMNWLSVGLFALALMLLVEFTAVLWVRGLSLAQYFAARDPVSSSVYFVLLGVFAVLPVLVFQFRPRSSPHSASSGRAA
jgi:hypothetical protein